jgi:outer membrane murein-binding lipoprotein Lpp
MIEPPDYKELAWQVKDVKACLENASKRLESIVTDLHTKDMDGLKLRHDVDALKKAIEAAEESADKLSNRVGILEVIKNKLSGVQIALGTLSGLALVVGGWVFNYSASYVRQTDDKIQRLLNESQANASSIREMQSHLAGLAKLQVKPTNNEATRP